MKETATGAEQVSDQFVKTDASKDSMENLTTNIGVSFVNADNFLAEDGWIKVYDDETGDLLVTFTKDDWNKYTKENPYKFDLPVKHIRVETSETQPSQYFTVYSKKELDDEYITTNYTREQFDELQYIRSQFSVYAGEKLIVWDYPAGKSFKIIYNYMNNARSSYVIFDDKLYINDGLNYLSQTYHKLYRKFLSRGVWKEKDRPILLNNWEATGMTFDEESILKIASKGKEAGVHRTTWCQDG